MDAFFQPKYFEIELPNLDTPKTIMHFSDAHLLITDEGSTEEERAHAAKRTEEWNKTKIYFAKLAGESYDEVHLLPTEKILEKYSTLADELGVDGVLCTGDLWEAYMTANVRFTREALKKFRMPFIWARGNHEGGNHPEYEEFMNGNPQFQVLKLGNLKMIVIDNAKKTVTAQQLVKIKEELSDSSATVLCYHVPIRTKMNEEELLKRGDYFSIGEGDGGEETATFLKWITSEECPLTITLAGHLHIPSDTMISEKCRQIVVSSSMIGNVNIYRFVQEKTAN